MKTTQEIKDMMLYGERINIEYKEAASDLPKSLWETYSSFANTIGGTIVLGIKEHRNKSVEAGKFEIRGVGDADKMLKTFWDTINSDKVSRNILVDEDVECVNYEDKTLLIVHVPQANYTMRPIYINKNLIGGTFKRNYEGDYHCTDDEVKSMLRDANENGNDGVLIEHYDMNDIDLPTLHAYRNRFEVRNVDHAFNQLDDKDFLRNMGGYTTDRSIRREGLTMAGLLMFGKGLSVRDRFDNLRMDYIDKTNLVDDIRWSDRLTYDGMWENNLYNFFTRVVPKLTADLKRPFRLEGLERIDDTPVHKAVREGMTNMIIHADLCITGVLKVEKYDKEFVFSNPGSLKLPIADIMRGGNSKARNPRIQNMLRMIGYGDNIGSGYPTILKTWKEQNWRKPTLLDRTELRQVDLTLPMISLLPKTVLEEMKHYYGSAVYDLLTANEQQILAYVWNGDSISNIELQQLLGLNSIEAGKLLHQMVKKGLMNQNNKNRWTIYTIHKEQVANESMEKSMEKSKEKSMEKSEEKSEEKSKEKSMEKSEEKSEEKSMEKSKEKSEEKLTPTEIRVVELIQKKSHHTYKTLSQTLGFTESYIYKVLNQLKKKNVIKREGGRKEGFWVVIDSEERKEYE